jgi:protein involved in polysaccharide export with SLBB domain
MMNRQPVLITAGILVARRIVELLVWTALFALVPLVVIAQQPDVTAPQPVVIAPQPVKEVSPKVIAGSGSQPSRADIDQYRIGPGDQISIDVFGKATLSRVERVDTRGMIRMPLIDEDIRAACRTENELADDIGQAYRVRQLLKNPSVSVSVKDFKSQPVAVIGAVNSPGQFILQRSVRLLELVVFHAGGPSVKAGRKVQVLSTAPAISCEANPNPVSVNTTPIQVEGSVVTYDLKDMLQGSEAMNPYVHQGDIINIPAAEEVLLVGRVLKPAAISIGEPMTLARAIATVGGILPDSRKDKIRITRQIPGSAATTEIFIDLKATDKSRGESFLLQGGDIVEVSGKSGFQAALNSFTKSLLPMATGLPLRVIAPY